MFFLKNKLKWDDLTRFNFFYPPFKYDVGRCLSVEKNMMNTKIIWILIVLT